jgi:hypothetical protein
MVFAGMRERTLRGRALMPPRALEDLDRIIAEAKRLLEQLHAWDRPADAFPYWEESLNELADTLDPREERPGPKATAESARPQSADARYRR